MGLIRFISDRYLWQIHYTKSVLIHYRCMLTVAMLLMVFIECCQVFDSVYWLKSCMWWCKLTVAKCFIVYIDWNHACDGVCLIVYIDWNPACDGECLIVYIDWNHACDGVCLIVYIDWNHACDSVCLIAYIDWNHACDGVCLIVYIDWNHACDGVYWLLPSVW